MVRECKDPKCAHDDPKKCAYIKSQRKIHRTFFATDDPARYITWGPLSEAVEMCADCPVSKECLEFASLSPHSWKHGVYGGLLGSQRFFAPHSRTEANLERAQRDQEFILSRVREGTSPEDAAHELQEARRGDE